MRRRRRARVGQEKRKRENKRPILWKLFAALFQSFRGQHCEKMKGSARGNWCPREGQQPFRPNPNGVGDRTTTLRRLLIGAEPVLSLVSLTVFMSIFKSKLPVISIVSSAYFKLFIILPLIAISCNVSIPAFLIVLSV